MTDTLKNGAEILAINEEARVVLAKFRDSEYVTWSVDPAGFCYWGHYFNDDIVAATKDYEKRVAEAN